MKITDSAVIRSAKDKCSELRDGLFTVVAQHLLIEMISVHNYESDASMYIIETSELDAEKYDHVCNSSYTSDTIDVSIYDAFSVNRQTVAFDDLSEAHAFYFAFICEHNHL